MKKESEKVNSKTGKVRKTHPKIIFSALAALICIFLSFKVHWIFIIPAIILWWINKKYINKHFGV